MTAENLRPETPFHDLDHFLALPRVSSLTLSPDGSRLVTSVSTLERKNTSYTTALWELDPQGARPAHRITRSARGESGAAFLANGDLLFTSMRPDPEDDDAEPVAALWKLPASGGEALLVLSRPGGVSGVIAAKDADTAVISATVLAGSRDEEDDASRRKTRKDMKVGAVLHSGYPVRYWDHDLGPAEPRLFAVEEGERDSDRPVTTDVVPPMKLRNLTPDAGTSLRETTAVLTPDGRTLVTSQSIPLPGGDRRTILTAVDVATGTHRTLLMTDGVDYSPGPVSPDGSTIVVSAHTDTDAHTAPTVSLGLVTLDGGTFTPLAPAWDRWPEPAAWLPDGSAVVVTADEDGASPIFIVDAASGAVRRVTQDAAAYTDVVLSPDGTYAYALRSSYAFPAEPVRVELATGNTEVLPGPVERPQLPGRLERLETTAADGTRIASWLVLPEGASAEDPAPMLLWIHGGPLGSWNAWSWRWTPWLLAAKGYAVLLPDPALSTGYGQDFVQRGWGQWGGKPYTDLLAAVDAAVKRRDIDATRIAAMGGSFGGYMANWVAGHTDRFRCIVTHASLWALDQFGHTTDVSTYWQKEMTPEMARENSPHHFVANIRTPLLVIHGDKDYRVPIGEGLRLWYDLIAKSQLAINENGETDHRFLYFPDENHWILQPQHARVWYLVVENFLARHVLGKDTELPQELGL